MCWSSAHCRTSQLLRRPYHLAMPCMSGSSGNFPPTSQPAAPPVWTLCLRLPRPLAGLPRIPSTPLSASARPFTTDVGPPTLPQPPVICSAAWQWLCGIGPGRHCLTLSSPYSVSFCVCLVTLLFYVEQKKKQQQKKKIRKKSYACTVNTERLRHDPFRSVFTAE